MDTSLIWVYFCYLLSYSSLECELFFYCKLQLFINIVALCATDINPTH